MIRKGGAKEARLRKKELVLATDRKVYDDGVFAIKILNTCPLTSDEAIRRECCKYGEVIDMTCPLIMDTLTPSKYKFVRFANKNEGQMAIDNLNGFIMDNCCWHVSPAVQECFFTNDTGSLTNVTLPHNEVVEVEFDSSMPETHYEAKFRAQPLNFDDMITLKVENLAKESTADVLREYFGRFGDVGNVHRPINMETKLYHDFAFVRYYREDEVERALEEANGSWLFGKEMFIKAIKQRTYYGQDESTNSPKKKRP